MANKKPNEPAQDEEQQAQPDPQQTAQETARPGQQERKLDYAPHGGRYIVNGQLVDANGEPVRDK